MYIWSFRSVKRNFMDV